MNPWPDTRDTLLTRLRNPADRLAWEEFTELYEPLIYRFARRRGLQDADAQDITQRVLWAVARAADRWEPSGHQGSFRAWLAKVTTNAVINFIGREGPKRASGRTSVWELLEQTPQPSAEVSADWQHEHRCQMFRIAATRVKNNFTEDSWQAFWRTAVEGAPGEDVARELGKSIGSVYAARCRILARIRKTVEQIEQEETKLP